MYCTFSAGKWKRSQNSFQSEDDNLGLSFFSMFYILLIRSSSQPGNILKSGYDLIIIVTLMWEITVHAGFYSVFQEFTVSTTGFPECIEGTITKQTVKVRLRNSFMAWKIFTFFILKKLIIFAQNGFLQSKHNHSIIISEQQADRKKCEWHKNCISVGNDTFCPFYHYNI